MTSSDAIPPSRYSVRFGMRSLLILFGLLALLFAGYGWVYRKVVAPRRHVDAIEVHLRTLVNRRPDDMSAAQWESAVGWTMNLHGNSLYAFQSDVPTLRAFEERLANRLAGDVDMDTIHWIWDEYADLCPGGERYQRLRPLMVEEVEKSGGNWGLNVP